MPPAYNYGAQCRKVKTLQILTLIGGSTGSPRPVDSAFEGFAKKPFKHGGSRFRRL
jgi:hypothetical protein